MPSNMIFDVFIVWKKKHNIASLFLYYLVYRINCMGNCLQQNNNNTSPLVLSHKDINLKDRNIIVIFS